MVNEPEVPNWKSVWGDPQLGDWDLDDMKALIDPDDWKTFDENMNKAYTQWLQNGGYPGSIPGWMLHDINVFLEWHGLRPQVWWAELYGR